jgi:hypothetical protein
MKWEYKTLKIETTGFFFGGDLDEESLDATMNELGGLGWELVSAFDTSSSMQGKSRYVVAIFKRPH